MKAAVLTIGDELTCGYRLDTNSQAISRRLVSVPIDVALHLTVGDTFEDIQRGLHTTLGVADVVIATGGLGPTEDDLTRQTIAAHFGLELVEDPEALARIAVPRLLAAQNAVMRRMANLDTLMLFQPAVDAGVGFVVDRHPIRLLAHESG